MNWLTPSDVTALVLSLKLALISSVTLLIVGLPLCYAIFRSSGWLRHLSVAITALPLVLPPTVLGFYLLVLLSPDYLGSIPTWFGFEARSYAFRFEALVLASCVSSLPFFVQPVLAGMSRINSSLIDAAATLGHSPISRFWRVILPESRGAIVAGLILVAAHTLGEFGVILLIGGSIPGETKVLSIALYEHIESFDLSAAAGAALTLLLISLSLVILISVLGGLGQLKNR